MRIFIFGDSIAQGFYDTAGGWVARLASTLHQKSLDNMLHADSKSTFSVFNLGVSGDSTEGVLSRIKQEVEARRINEDDDLIILAIGINDSVLKDDNTVLMDVYQFQTSYEKLMNEALALTDRIYCVGLTAVDENITSPWPYSSTGKQYRNNRINLFEDSIKQSCERLSVPFIPIHDEFLEQLGRGKELLSDGVHPNDAGHELLANVVIESVVNKN